jgi:hypothetical protein
VDIVVSFAWTEAKWLSDATDWIQGELDRLGHELNGTITQPHVRPWSTVLKIPLDGEALYFKAASNELRYEVPLMLELRGMFPHLVPEIVAANEKRGWMIQRDGGSTLREEFRNNPTLSIWETVLSNYAELQVQLIDTAGLFLEIGVPDRRLSNFPKLFSALLSDTEVLRLDEEDGVSVSERARILSTNVPGLCSKLAAFEIPPSLDHGDFHDGNIFFNRGTLGFFDWGDSSISHPFFSLRTAFVSVENTFGIEEHAPQFKRLEDAYLEVWESFEDRPRLKEAFSLSRKLWAIGSALRWQRVVSPLSEAQRQPYEHAVPGLLHEFLDSNPAVPDIKS